MKVLLSIKPEYAEQILKGKKKFEFRKSIFKNSDVDTVIIYATMPIGKIIGEFKIGNIISLTPNELWKHTERYAGISRTFFDEYFFDRDIGFAITVENPTRYSSPINLQDLIPGATPPQSFRYI